jgi:hypothetical protein
MSPSSTEPIAIQTLGVPFFRQYMARYPEVFQKWVLEYLGYEYKESYKDQLFPHISELPKGYDKSPEESEKAYQRRKDKEGPKDDSWPFGVKLEEVPEFIYYANLRNVGKPKFQTTYIQFKLLEQNDALMEVHMLGDFMSYMRYSTKFNLMQKAFYIGDYPFHSPTTVDGGSLKSTFDLTDLTQLPTHVLTQHPDFHIHVLAMFNHLLPESEKVDFIVSGMVRTYQEKGAEEAEYYFRLLELTETPKNLPALNQIFARLAHTPEYQHLHRNALAEYPRTVDPLQQQIMQVMVDKTIAIMYKTNKDAQDSASTMKLEPVEFQMLLNQIEAMGGVVKAEKPAWMKRL